MNIISDISEIIHKLKSYRDVVIHVGSEINSLAEKDQIMIQGRPSSRRYAHRASSSCHSNPTKAHMALAQLINEDRVKYLMTENTDGMLLKAGADDESVIEINGNIHTEECMGCGLSFVREFCVQTSHCGTRSCQLCGAKLQDTVVRNTSSPDIEQKESIRMVLEKAEMIIVLGSPPISHQSTKYVLPHFGTFASKVLYVSEEKPIGPSEASQWFQSSPMDFLTPVCQSFDIEISKFRIYRKIRLMITRELTNDWLIRTHCVTSGGRHFSCLKGVDVIPCVDGEELDVDPEVLCYDPFQCTIPINEVTDKAQLEIYYLFFGFNQEPEWSVGVPLRDAVHEFYISCCPGDEEWKVYPELS